MLRVPRVPEPTTGTKDRRKALLLSVSVFSELPLEFAWDFSWVPVYVSKGYAMEVASSRQKVTGWFQDI